MVLEKAPAQKVGNRGEKGKAVDYKETGSDVTEPSMSVSPVPMAMKKMTGGGESTETGCAGVELSVQDPAKAKESQDEEWLEAIASTPIQDSPTEATVAVVEATLAPTTELAPSARTGPSSAEAAFATEAVASVAVEHPVVPVQVEIVPQNCEDAIK